MTENLLVANFLSNFEKIRAKNLHYRDIERIIKTLSIYDFSVENL